MQRQINIAVRKMEPVAIKVTADITEFRNRIRSLQDRFQDIEIGIQPRVDAEQFRRQVQRRLRGVYVTIQVRPDWTGFDEAVSSHNAPPISIEVNPDVNTSQLRRAVNSINGSLGKLAGITKMTLSFGALGIAAAGAASSIGALGAALAPAAGIIAAGPAVILGYQAALGALKIALDGVSEAFSAGLTGDAKEFEEATKNLSPAARAAANEVRALRPAFENLRNEVQDNFFVQIEGQITKTAQALSGPMTRGLSDISGQWGRAANNVLGYVQGTKGVADVTAVLGGAREAVTGLALGTNKLTAGFLQAAATVSKAFGPQLGSGIQNTLNRLGEFLQRAAGDGRLVKWVDDALTALAQLGSLLSNLGGIISGVFRAAGAAGGGFLQNLVLVTNKFREFVESAEGQEAITNVFRTLAAVASQLGPIIVSLVNVIGTIAPALAPLFTAIGPAITGIINALLPAIEAILPGIRTVVDAIVTMLGEITSSGALADLGEVIGTILTALAPLLPVIGQIAAAVVTALAPAFIAVAEAVTPVVQAIANALIPVLPPLIDAVLQIVTALAPFVDIIGRVLALAIAAVAPLLTTLAQLLGKIAEALAPLITQLLNAFLPVIDKLVPVITRLVDALTPLIESLVAALLPVLPPLVDALIALLNAMLPLIDPIVGLVEALAPLLVTLVNLLAPILTFAANILKWVTIETVVPSIELVVSVMLKIIQAATDVINGVKYFVDTVVNFFTFLWNDSGRIIGSLVRDIGNWFSRLWSTVTGWVSRTVSDVARWFQDMYTTNLQRVTNLIMSVVNLFRTLPGRAASALSGLASAIGSQIASAASATISRITGFVSDAVNLFRTLPGKVRSALGNLSSYLFSAGVDLIRGMINGVRSMAGSIASAAKNVVKGAVDGAKDFLGISSPSKVFREFGEFTGEGFVLGVESMGRAVAQAARSMAETVAAPFSGNRSPAAALAASAVRPVSSLSSPMGVPGAQIGYPGTYGGRGVPGEQVTVNNTFVINEVGNAEATASRVVNRLALAAGVL